MCEVSSRLTKQLEVRQRFFRFKKCFIKQKDSRDLVSTNLWYFKLLFVTFVSWYINTVTYYHHTLPNSGDATTSKMSLFHKKLKDFMFQLLLFYSSVLGDGYGHKKCHYEYDTVYETVYHTIYKKACTTHYDKKCHIEYDHTYETKYHPKCHTSYHPVCHTYYSTKEKNYTFFILLAPLPNWLFLEKLSIQFLLLPNSYAKYNFFLSIKMNVKLATIR